MIPPIPLHEAQARLLELVRQTPVETVPCEDALGRYLAEPVLAGRRQPSADLSAMDGFAVAADGPWRIVGESRCGAPFEGTLKPGEATKISTGAHMPVGADAVVVIEDAELGDANSLRAAETPVPGRHIRRAGEDFEAGSRILDAGTRVMAPQIALARMAGESALRVRAVPKLSILECGDELAEDQADCAAHQIPATNGAMLRAMAKAERVHIEHGPPVADNLDSLIAAVEAQSAADLLVFSGGASVGDHDLVRPALERSGANIDFWRVAIKPGKPLMVATRGSQIILGLPGNPVSSYVTAFLFMLPALRKMLGAERCIPHPLALPCSEALPEGGPRRTFIRARLENGTAVPLAQQSSGALGALAQTDVLIERAEHCAATDAGAHVPAYLLGNGYLA
ncbi:molybdopterin molybdotransferase MoeA [Pontixanthobacter aquaemixtae]|uniref:Molybdopterin molybdenumtransferase n=1 Tax=Pontixanthobacter aquaemixtae TaxID=1958940 RepID=A0A844ZS56_9SPHN|nr:molybdopterin molybdotransferase MoeA [Pontixanthobacter aquaemixtae]MXO90324.1 molybdopterin molybdenumtransferase MoeA [Pontixanthobacter aquaemixtae]